MRTVVLRMPLLWPVLQFRQQLAPQRGLGSPRLATVRPAAALVEPAVEQARAPAVEQARTPAPARVAPVTAAAPPHCRAYITA